MPNYAYCRASTVVQETSCAVQEDLIRQAVQRDDEEVDHVFTDEDTSGRVFPFLDREAAKQLMNVVQPNDDLWVHKIDRLGRNTVDILNTITMLMNREVHVRVLDFGGQAMNLEGATGFALVAMQAVFAEVEGKRIAERTVEALKYRRERGMPVNGYSPFGMKRYKRREPHGKPWVNPPTRADRSWGDSRVRRAYRWYACLRELGLDVESTPVHIATIFSTAWRKAKMPRSIAQWRGADRDGLKEFASLVKREAVQA